MVSIIKNQIIKHISKFTKNLSQDKIGLSTLKGEGTLTNLELDEEVLMEVLDLPSWIVITKAVCNRVNVKIPWTKLKTHPICIYLDEVCVEMRTCRELRTPNVPSGKQQISSGPSKYGYVEKVIDGMYVHVNSISGTFLSDTFRGDIQISQLLLQSTTPDWKPANLRATRLNLQEEGEVITFKQVEWSTVRIIVDAIYTKITGPGSTPIRLITNQGHVRIAMKKRINDCSLVASKLQVLLDDILLVLTDSQLKAVILHFRSLSPVIQKATAQSNASAAEKGQLSGSSKSAQDLSNQGNQANRTTTEYQYLQIVKKHDVVETSYHLLTRHVDLHLCDELNRKDTETPERRIEGGSMQVSLQGFSLDYYPFHSAGSTRTHWNFFDESFETSETWIHSLLAHFKQQYSAARREIDKLQKEANPAQASTANVSPKRAAPPHANPNKPVTSSKGKPVEVKGQDVKYSSKTQSVAAQQAQAPPQRKAVKLMSHCIIIRVQGYKFSAVATAAKLQRNDQEEVHCLLMSDKKTFCLPDDVPSIHLEYTSFYFPNELDFPVPSPIMFIQCNPMVFYLDTMTVLWLNQFCFNILQTLPDLEEFAPTAEDEGQDHTDIRLNALMPKIIIPAEPDCIRSDQPDRPQQLQIQMSQLTATNCRIGNNLNRPSLSKLLQSLNKHKLVIDRSSFPGMSEDTPLIPQLFWKHAFEQNFYMPEGITSTREGKVVENGAIPQKGSQSMGTAPSSTHTPKLQTNSFRKDACDDIWGVEVDQIWAEFTGVPSSLDSRPVPFVEPIPLHAWLTFPPKKGPDHSQDSQITVQGERNSDISEAGENTGDLHALLEFTNPVHVILNHYQFLFLMRLQNSLKSLTEDIEKDQLLFSSKAPTVSSQVVAVECPAMQVTLLLPEEPSIGGEGVSPMGGGGEPVDTTLVADDREEQGSSGTPSRGSEGPPGRGSFNSQVQEEQVSNTNLTPIELERNLEKTLEDDEIGGVKITPATPQIDSLNGPPGVYVVPEGTNDEKVATKVLNTNDIEDSELHRSLSEASNLAAQDLSKSRRSTSPSLGRPTLHIQGERKSEEDLSGKRSGSHSSLNSSTSMQLSSLLLKSTSSLSLDEMASKEDLDLLSVDSDSSDGFSFVNRKGEQTGSMQDVGSESGFGSELSQPLAASQQEKLPNELEAAGTGDSTNPESVTDFSDNPFKLKGISVVRALLHDVSVGVIMVGKDLSVKAEVQTFVKAEDGNTDFDVFMGKFDSGDQKTVIDALETDPSSSGPVVMLRFDAGPAAEKLCDTAQERGYVQLKARNIDVDVLQTTLSHISGLVLDEIKAPPMPIRIWVEDSHVKLIDNVRPAFPTNIEGNSLLPLEIPSLHVFRSPDGVFHVEGISTYDNSDESISRSEGTSVRVENENKQLQQRIKMMEEAMEVLEHERISLMSTLEHLQEELLTSDRHKDDLLYKLNEMRRKVELGK